MQSSLHKGKRAITPLLRTKSSWGQLLNVLKCMRREAGPAAPPPSSPAPPFLSTGGRGKLSQSLSLSSVLCPPCLFPEPVPLPPRLFSCSAPTPPHPSIRGTVYEISFNRPLLRFRTLYFGEWGSSWDRQDSIWEVALGANLHAHCGRLTRQDSCLQ